MYTNQKCINPLFKYVLKFINNIINISAMNTFFDHDIFLLDTRLMLFQKVNYFNALFPYSLILKQLLEKLALKCA